MENAIRDSTFIPSGIMPSVIRVDGNTLYLSASIEMSPVLSNKEIKFAISSIRTYC